MDRADVRDTAHVERQMQRHEQDQERDPSYEKHYEVDKHYEGWSKEDEEDDDGEDQIIYRHESGEI